MLQTSDELEEASSVAGSKWSRTYVRILFPMMKVAVLASFTYIFLDTFRELGTGTLLTSLRTYLHPTFSQNLFSSGGTTLPVTAAASCFMMLVGGIFLVIASKLLGVDLLSREGTILAPPPVPREQADRTAVPMAVESTYQKH